VSVVRCGTCGDPATYEVRAGKQHMPACDRHLSATQRAAGVPRTTVQVVADEFEQPNLFDELGESA
jgi:hypothetical protein